MPNLAIIPADPDLAGAEIELVAEPRREFRLRDALQALDEFELIIIDCPPSLSLLTLNGLVASTSILVPAAMRVFLPSRDSANWSRPSNASMLASTRQQASTESS